MATIAVLPLARSTFDVSFAEDILNGAQSVLAASGHDLVGPQGLLLDGSELEAALKALAGKTIDRVLVLQVTFTDAEGIVAIHQRLAAPMAIWAFPEPRTGGRLRLNSFCGLNLAAHALGLRDIPFGYYYGRPDNPGTLADVSALLAGGRMAQAREAVPAAQFGSQSGNALVASLKNERIGCLGEHPPGFDTCAYDPAKLEDLTGMQVEPIELDALFDRARAVSVETVQPIRERAESDLADLDEVDQDELDKSLRLKAALSDLRRDSGCAAFAVRCWPETFTQYGGAICGPVSMMGEERIPCACEADVYGAVTTLVLQRIVDEPVFLFDLVDIDGDDNSAVIWHCGQAPISLADPDYALEATIHSNRKMPLLYQFPLKPGRVTLARISQARGSQTLVIVGADMLKAPLAYSGTAGTLRFDRPACDVADAVLGAGLEHHMALAYGDHRDELRSVAAGLGIPILELA